MTNTFTEGGRSSEGKGGGKKKTPGYPAGKESKSCIAAGMEKEKKKMGKRLRKASVTESQNKSGREKGGVVFAEEGEESMEM